MAHAARDTFATTYPNIAHFIKTTGTIEIGHRHEFAMTSFIRALDLGGIIWERADD